MSALAKAFAHALNLAAAIDFPKQIAMACGAAIIVSLLLHTYGLDLSPGLF